MSPMLDEDIYSRKNNKSWMKKRGGSIRNRLGSQKLKGICEREIHGALHLVVSHYLSWMSLISGQDEFYCDCNVIDIRTFFFFFVIKN